MALFLARLLLYEQGQLGFESPAAECKAYDCSTTTVIGSMLVFAAVRRRLLHGFVLSFIHRRVARPVKTIFQRYRGFRPSDSLCFRVAWAWTAHGGLLGLPVRPMQRGRHCVEYFFVAPAVSSQTVHSVDRRGRLPTAALLFFKLHGGLSVRTTAENSVPWKSRQGNLRSLAAVPAGSPQIKHLLRRINDLAKADSLIGFQPE